MAHLRYLRFAKDSHIGSSYLRPPTSSHVFHNFDLYFLQEEQGYSWKVVSYAVEG